MSVCSKASCWNTVLCPPPPPRPLLHQSDTRQVGAVDGGVVGEAAGGKGLLDTVLAK